MAMLNEWKKTCLPPQNEEVNIFWYAWNLQIFLIDEWHFPISLAGATVEDDKQTSSGEYKGWLIMLA